MKVIRELTVQRAHNELLTMMLGVEYCRHRNVQKLLTAALLLLQQISTHLRNRMVCDASNLSFLIDRDVFKRMAAQSEG